MGRADPANLQILDGRDSSASSPLLDHEPPTLLIAEIKFPHGGGRRCLFTRASPAWQVGGLPPARGLRLRFTPRSSNLGVAACCPFLVSEPAMALVPLVE